MFTVIIPLFNKAPHISKAIESVLHQTLAPEEIIVVNDGSTDGSEEVVEKHFANSVNLVNQVNGGDCAARNAGMSIAKSEYLVFLDADDWWEANHLEVLAKLIASNPQAAMYSTVYNIHREDGYVRPRSSYPEGWSGLVDDFFSRFAQGLSLVHSSTVCVRRNALVAIGGFPERLPRGGDIIAWSKLGMAYPVAHTETVTAVYDHASVNRSDKIVENEPPGHLLFLAETMNSNKLDVNGQQGIILFFEKVAFYTSAGFALVGDRRGARKVGSLSWTAGRYKAACAIYLVSLLPAPLLFAARKLRHFRF